MDLVANSLFSRDDATQWVVLGVGALATLWLVMRPKLKRRSDPLEYRPSLGVSQQRQIERDMNNLMVEMLETARQMAAQLETRATKLAVLIGEADRKLEELRRAAGGARPSGSAAPVETAPTVAAPLSQSADLADRAEPTQRAEPAETPPDPRHAEIYSMADQGRTAREIARVLGRPNGEVELILALRRR